MATQADGRAERDAGLLMMHAQWKRVPWRRRTLAADKAYDVREFVDVTRELGCTPHVAQNLDRSGGSAIDARTTRRTGYAMNQHARPRIEPAFGWFENDRVDAEGQTPRAGEGRLVVGVRERRLQSDSLAETAAASHMRRVTCLHSAARRR
jgi:hypothetical protein